MKNVVVRVVFYQVCSSSGYIAPFTGPYVSVSIRDWRRLKYRMQPLIRVGTGPLRSFVGKNGWQKVEVLYLPLFFVAESLKRGAINI